MLTTLQGIKISSDHILLTALDHRAATFEKLNQLQPALKDAREMIELKPGLAKVGSLYSICVKSIDYGVQFRRKFVSSSKDRNVQLFPERPLIMSGLFALCENSAA